MAQDPQLEAIVQRMIDAGEPEENISLVIREYKPQSVPASPAPSFASAGMMAPSTATEKAPTLGVMDRAVKAASVPGVLATGAAKGAANTVIGLGEAAYRYVPGVKQLSDAINGQPAIEERKLSGLITGAQPRNAFETAREAVKPSNNVEKAGYYGEQIGEFALPTGATGKAGLLAEMGKSAALTGAQGGSAKDAGTSAAMAAVIPGAGAMKRVGTAVSDSAVPLVRAAVKPTVSALKRITGAGGMDAKANALMRFIIDNRLTTPEKARALFQQTEQELQGVLSANNVPTDAATRAQRYLSTLERSAAKQGLPADDIAQIRRAGEDLLNGPMGEDVVTQVPTSHPTLVGPNGQPITVMSPQTTRALRPDVPANEALTSARSSSQWSTRKAWGEQKGATTEAAKAVERAQRDAVKAAVPEAQPLLAKEGKAIDSERVLDRMAQRASNRDVVSLPAHVIAAGELASGRVPFMAAAANWLRNNQMRAGIWADMLGKAIQSNDALTTAAILKRLGVGATSQAMR